MPTGGAPALDPVLVFDTCQPGVILRAVMFVQAIAWVAALFRTDSLLGWVTDLAVFTSATLPAVLIWLLVTCAFKRYLARLGNLMQWAAGVALGA